MSNYTFRSQKAAAIKRAEAATKGKLREFALTMQRKAKIKARTAYKQVTGNNARSITFDLPGPMQARVFTESGYGGFLELGTTRMAARPYFAPAYEETKQAFERIKWDE